MDYITDKLSSSVIARLKEWALGTANQWLHDHIGRYLENLQSLSTPTLIALGVAALAALVLMTALASKVLKAVTSGRGMLVTSAVMLTGLGVVWFTWAKPQLPFFGLQTTAMPAAIEEQSILANALDPVEEFEEEIEPEAFYSFPPISAAPSAPLALPAAVIPSIPAPVVIGGTTPAANHPAGHSGSSGHTPVTASSAPAAIPANRTVHATSVASTTPAPAKPAHTNPPSAPPAKTATTSQPKPAASSPSKVTASARTSTKQGGALQGSATGRQSSNRQALAAHQAQTHQGFGFNGMNAGYGSGQTHHAQLQAQQRQAQRQMELYHMEMMVNQQMHHMMNGYGMGTHPMYGGHEFTGHPMGGGHPAAHHLAGHH